MQQTVTPTPQNSLDPIIESKLDIMMFMHKHLITNDYGLPKYLYRPDMLPDDIPAIELFEHEDILQAATIDVNFAEGYPTINFGQPIWERFDFEPQHCYELFDHYIQTPENSGSGVRTLHQLLNYCDDDVTLIELHTCFYMYYWPQRARAFDLFKEVVHRKRRALRACQLEDMDYLRASTLLDSIYNYMMDPNGSFLEELTPNTAKELLKLSIDWRRTSAGLNGDSKSGPKTTTEQNIEVVLKDISNNNGSDAKDITPNNMNVADNNNLHSREQILRDPDMASKAQELIIRLQTSTTSTSNTISTHEGA